MMTHMENMDHKIYSCGGPYFISVCTILTPVSFKPLRTQDSLRAFFFFCNNERMTTNVFLKQPFSKKGCFQLC